MTENKEDTTAPSPKILSSEQKTKIRGDLDLVGEHLDAIDSMRDKRTENLQKLNELGSQMLVLIDKGKKEPFSEAELKSADELKAQALAIMSENKALGDETDRLFAETDRLLDGVSKELGVVNKEAAPKPKLDDELIIKPKPDEEEEFDLTDAEKNSEENQQAPDTKPPKPSPENAKKDDKKLLKEGMASELEDVIRANRGVASNIASKLTPDFVKRGVQGSVSAVKDAVQTNIVDPAQAAGGRVLSHLTGKTPEDPAAGPKEPDSTGPSPSPAAKEEPKKDDTKTHGM